MNRRSEPRFDVYYRAKLIPLETPENQIEALLTDISGGGMRLVASEELPEDQMICVEVGQHLVLAEVRRSVPRGNRFVIGAEKIHTLNLLTLPDSMSGPDRIQALVDDYHLRIQFALEAERGREQGQGQGQEQGQEQSQEQGKEPGQEPVKESSQELVQAQQPEPTSEKEANPAPALAAPVPEPKDDSTDFVEEIPATVPPVSVPALETAAPDVPTAEGAPEATTTPVGVGDESAPATLVPSPPEDPGMAPPMRTDPAPANVPLVPVTTSVELDLMQLQIMLPEGRGQNIATETQLETGAEEKNAEVALTDAASDASPANSLTDQALFTEPAPSQAQPEQPLPGRDIAELPAGQASPDLPRPVQPIWMGPPGGSPSEGETPAESDPLRNLAIQQELAGVGQGESRGHSRTVLALAAAVIAAVALAALLFGPIRNRALLLLPASASEKGAKSNPTPQPVSSANPTDPVAQAETAAPKPEGGDSKESPAAGTPSVASAPAAASAKPAPATTPVPTPAASTPASTPAPAPASTPVKSPPAASIGGSRAHSSSIRTSAASWLWACADGKAVAGRILPAGSALEIEFSRQAQVLIGNAGAVEMALDGKPLGPLGPEGRARVVELTPTGFHVAAAVGSQDCGN